ncbi:2'-5' RNA ligase [Acinetobacter sp. ANC 5054]|uniref:2'-5' RNA ligase family protein n=1 Tax=Acinetobacter sp. ANC 5054 TaxID=1977877 RepID=UPI000A33171C|nr:2'-5' RNA ligase family protein [Acinetobacter sp. ANC 5054]OTG79501.1 2'-5' RNA ligase [Acinetobacter sp. ANC 5054]
MFLKPSTTVVPTLDQDYPDWHQGRQHYALWYLEILEPELLAYLTALREHFSDILYTPNTRQFHITLFICGFFESVNAQGMAKRQGLKLDDDYGIEQLKQHQQQLKQCSHGNLRLCTGKINSFQSALFIEVQDPEQKLKQIRNALNLHHEEIAALEYCPHITIGLYKNAINSDDVFARIKEIQQQTFNIETQHITFGTYQAQILQGPLSAYYHHQLQQKSGMATT